jgi:hypothetical protein
MKNSYVLLCLISRASSINVTANTCKLLLRITAKCHDSCFPISRNNFQCVVWYKWRAGIVQSVQRLDGRVFGVRVPEGAKIFSLQRCPDRFLGPGTLSLLSNRHRCRGVSFHGGKTALCWSWPLTSN